MPIRVEITGDTASEIHHHLKTLADMAGGSDPLTMPLADLADIVKKRMTEAGFSVSIAGALTPKLGGLAGEAGLAEAAAQQNAHDMAQEAAPEAEETPPPKKATKPRPAKKAAPAPAPEPEEPVDEEEQVDDTPSTESTKELLDLQEKCIRSLQAAFAGGAADKVRTILRKHNARNFNTIPVDQFPAIAKSMKEMGLDLA